MYMHHAGSRCVYARTHARVWNQPDITEKQNEKTSSSVHHLVAATTLPYSYD